MCLLVKFRLGFHCFLTMEGGHREFAGEKNIFLFNVSYITMFMNIFQ